MIIKYKNENAWGYIDGIENVTREDLDQKYCLSEYIRKLNNREILEPDVECETSTIRDYNRIVYIALDMIAENLEGYTYSTDLFLREDFLPTEEYDYPACCIIMNIKDRNEFDKRVIFSNQEVYLLNDDGKTIERLN